MAGVDDYVLTADVLDAELEEIEGMDRLVPVTKVVAHRGDKLPKSLKDEQDLFVAEGILVPSATFDRLNEKAWHAPSFGSMEADQNADDAGYSKSQLAKIEKASEEAEAEVALQKPPVAGTGKAVQDK